MKKLLIFLILACFFLPLSSANAENEIEAIVIEKTDYSIKVLFGDDTINEFRVYDLQLRGDCQLDDFGPGYLIGISSTNILWPKGGDKILGSANIFSDFTILENLQSKEYSDCNILSAVYKPNEYFEMFYVNKIDSNNYLVESIFANTYSIEMSSNCLEESLGQESIIIVKKVLADKLSNSDEIISGIKVTQDLNIDFVNLTGCNISKSQLLSINSGHYQETLAEYNQFIFEDKEKHASLSVTVQENCPILEYNLGDPSIIGLYNPGEIYYLANKSDTYDQALYIKYDDMFCQVEKFRVINDYISPNTQKELYQAPLALWPQPPVINYYLRGQYQKKIFTDRADEQTIIGHLVKGETDPATYTVDDQGKLRWIRGEAVAKRLYGNDWDSKIIWFSDSIIYTYKFGESIYE